MKAVQAGVLGSRASHRHGCRAGHRQGAGLAWPQSAGSQPPGLVAPVCPIAPPCAPPHPPNPSPSTPSPGDTNIPPCFGTCQPPPLTHPSPCARPPAAAAPPRPPRRRRSGPRQHHHRRTACTARPWRLLVSAKVLGASAGGQRRGRVVDECWRGEGTWGKDGLESPAAGRGGAMMARIVTCLPSEC